MDVTVYSRPGCGVCTAVKYYLARNGIGFREFDVSQDPDAMQEMVNLTGGARSLPVVAVGEKAVVGFPKDRLDHLLGLKK